MRGSSVGRVDVREPIASGARQSRPPGAMRTNHEPEATP